MAIARVWLTYDEHVDVPPFQALADHLQSHLGVDLQPGNQVLMPRVGVWHPVGKEDGVLQRKQSVCHSYSYGHH